MGAYFSALFINQGGLSSVSSSSPSLGDLPESCVASIIGYLDPPEICKLGKLNRAFRGASWADFVWESKLPSNYQVLVDKILTFVPENLGKREIYSLLCTTNTLDGGTKQTWWFEVDGEVEFPFPAGSYSVFFRLQLGRSSKRFGRQICNSEHIHGWDKKPVRFQLWTSDGQHARSQCTLNEPGKWFHYHIGDFNVENSNSSTKIKLSMTQIDCTHTKGGLCLDSVVIYPSKYREKLQQKGFLRC